MRRGEGKEDYTMRIRFVPVVLMVMMLAAGCARPPAEQIEAAKTAVESARKAEADLYAPAAFKALQKSLDDALDMVERKNYGEATTMLEEVVSEAERVEALAKANKEKKGKESQAKFEEAMAAVVRAKESLEKAPTGKGSQADIERMKNDLATLAASLPEVEQAINRGDFLDALDTTESVLTGISEIETDVQGAIEKQQRLKSKVR